MPTKPHWVENEYEPKIRVTTRVTIYKNDAKWHFVIQGPGIEITEMMSRNTYPDKHQALKAAKKWRKANGLNWKIYYHRYSKLVAV